MASRKIQVFKHEYTEGDQAPEIVGYLKDTDITSYTITMYLDRSKTGKDVISKTATVVDATKGQFKFTWDTTDLVCGNSDGEIIATVRITDPGGKITTPPPFIIKVRPAPVVTP